MALRRTFAYTVIEIKWKEADMILMQKCPGNANDKRNSWERGNGAYSMRGELKHGTSLRKRELNRKVRHAELTLQHSSYKRIKPTLKMVDFS